MIDATLAAGMTVSEWGVIGGLILAVSGVLWRTATIVQKTAGGLRSCMVLMQRETKRIDRLEKRVFGIEPLGADSGDDDGA